MAGTELLIGTSLGEDGRYHLRRMLGTGGMSSVWLAEDERLGRPVAVKVLSDSLALDEAYVSRFEREARVAARLSHPNLVNVFDFSATPPRPYLAMEYVPGAPLGFRGRKQCQQLVRDCGGVQRRGLSRAVIRRRDLDHIESREYEAPEGAQQLERLPWLKPGYFGGTGPRRERRIEHVDVE